MSIVENPNDRVRFERIVNEPKRGIGNATLALLLQFRRICTFLRWRSCRMWNSIRHFPRKKRH